MICVEDAVILIHKPLYYTSFDVIRYLKKEWQIKKMGHCGTLDPLATGLLLLCSGKKTKDLTHYTGWDKIYTATFTIGAVTLSYDLETPPYNHSDYASVTERDIQETLASFRGTIAQKPPQYSAVKKDGIPLYVSARQGKIQTLPTRQVTIYKIVLQEVALPQITCQIHCSSGTYIRSLAFDFGEKLGVGAYLSALRRDAIGHFRLADALDILPRRSAFKPCKKRLSDSIKNLFFI